jgi:hypothetical protein
VQAMVVHDVLTLEDKDAFRFQDAPSFYQGLSIVIFQFVISPITREPFRHNHLSVPFSTGPHIGQERRIENEAGHAFTKDRQGVTRRGDNAFALRVYIETQARVRDFPIELPIPIGRVQLEALWAMQGDDTPQDVTLVRVDRFYDFHAIPPGQLRRASSPAPQGDRLWTQGLY